MSQPFRSGHGFYRPSVCEGITLELREDHIALRSPEVVLALSSAVYGGGFVYADSFINWKVPLTYNCSDPVKDLSFIMEQQGYSLNSSVGLITAANLTHASIMETDGDRFSILCCTTAGTTNAARAGLRRSFFPAYEAGTINTFLFIDGRMTSSAMVNAVITATEAKTAALQDLGIMETMHGRLATGTTTDSIVIALSQSNRYDELHAYAGTATTIGDGISRMVYETVHESVRTQNEG
ncbi:adenosylcobinamide amidohydrolase [Paenibacillus baekrokdamisoli]|uniref:Adenosylcobinamide amidohydrolase n=1 Tax=Paenibacillus baekrokdamisoli TaxID=1712516 RepID=A0A3G9IMA3_9BACL|nr:adenosylcobinamide amidohydrolase [Paenibacillus baekrokdamisoli]MBB3070619.1 adenosylcobinamide amidohydrolase [Paenibacillus baekrokdamisoli]BBH19970.1 adenosylcobinamide amidohydrolase [Paenibacillus baekrokdamisoli]